MEAPRMSLRLPPGTEEVARLLDEVEGFAESAGLPTALAMRLALVAEELAANVAMHGTGASFFAFTATLTPAGVEVGFEDDGPEFDPISADAASRAEGGLDAREAGGLGLHLIRKLARDLSWQRAQGRNRLTCLLPLQE